MKKKSKVKKWLNKLEKIAKKTKIWWLAVAAILASCGSTKAVVSQPAQGTYTTITITTNNPITTNVEPNTDATLNIK